MHQFSCSQCDSHILVSRGVALQQLFGVTMLRLPGPTLYRGGGPVIFLVRVLAVAIQRIGLHSPFAGY